MGRVFNASQALSEIARSAQPLTFINTAEYDESTGSPCPWHEGEEVPEIYAYAV
jgi:hypothetical protein